MEVLCDKLERESLWFCGCTQTPQHRLVLILSGPVAEFELLWGEVEATPSAPLLKRLPRLFAAHRSICVYGLKEACVLHRGVAGKALQPCEVI